MGYKSSFSGTCPLSDCVTIMPIFYIKKSQSLKWVPNPFVCDVAIAVTNVSGNGFTHSCEVAIAQCGRVLYLNEFYCIIIVASDNLPAIERLSTCVLRDSNKNSNKLIHK